VDTILSKLQAEIEARKQPRIDLRPAAYIGLTALLLLSLGVALGVRSAERELSAAWTTSAEIRETVRRQDARLAAFGSELDRRDAEMERLETVLALSADYGIGADLATLILETALRHDLDPRLAFEVVWIESRFNPRAVSPVGAVGLAQVMPATGRILRPGITRAELFEPETNLDLGFRYLRYLITRYGGDVRLALLAYNRGPTTVDNVRREGVDPANGYARTVLDRVAKHEERDQSFVWR
jgi:soluble lytic murein transglycosylase-like protein